MLQLLRLPTRLAGAHVQSNLVFITKAFPLSVASIDFATKGSRKCKLLLVSLYLIHSLDAGKSDIIAGRKYYTYSGYV